MVDIVIFVTRHWGDFDEKKRIYFWDFMRDFDAHFNNVCYLASETGGDFDKGI